MALRGKWTYQVEIKTTGDVFHELFGNKPHHIQNIAPEKVQGCELHHGEFGNEGSIIEWSYHHDGKARTAKQHIEMIDEENKTIIFKMIEGDLMELYKTFVITLHVDTKGTNNLVTWVFDYEKFNADVEDPTTTMAFLVALVKDIEKHHL